LCDCDIAINFGVVAGEVILVGSCVMIIIYFIQKKTKKTKTENENEKKVAVLFKMEFVVELGFNI